MKPNSPPPGTVWAQNLGKAYNLYRGPVERLKAALMPGSVQASQLVALEDVSFTIEPGTAVGVIGPNGAGKSTLLKILSGVLTPTTGSMGVEGRIASIIELGAGFHPEFTGRDNVLMNAELHGLTREEAVVRLESIARFSELGRYFDMPVRTYSSGMFVRLAFSLAVSVDPHVLLVDEALAVGDAVFVHRCLSRIRELRESGVTIFLVTHDTATVANLCDRALLIRSGRLAADGTPKEVIHRYLVHIAERLTRLESGEKSSAGFHTVGAHDSATSVEQISEARFGSFEARILDCAVEDLDGKRIPQVLGGTTVSMRMTVRFDRDVPQPIFGVMIRNRFGVEMYGTNTHLRQDPVPPCHHGDLVTVRFRIPLYLDSGAYGITFAVHAPNGDYYDYRTDAVVVEVVAAQDSGGLVRLPTQVEFSPGTVEDLPQSENPLDSIFPEARPSLNLTADDSHAFVSGGLAPDTEASTRGIQLNREGRIILRWAGSDGPAHLSLVLARDPNITDFSPTTLPVAWLDGTALVSPRVIQRSDSTQLEYGIPKSYRPDGKVVAVRLNHSGIPLTLTAISLIHHEPEGSGQPPRADHL